MHRCGRVEIRGDERRGCRRGSGEVEIRKAGMSIRVRGRMAIVPRMRKRQREV